MSTIVGFNLSHDSSACVVRDGVVVRALALERITGIKRGVVPQHTYAAAMAALTRDLLGDVGAGPDQVDHWIATSTETRDADEEALLLGSLGLLLPDGRRLVLPHPGHHLAHASAAFYSSGFADATALVADAYGSLVEKGRERETAFSFASGQAPCVLFRTLRREARIAGHRREGGLWIPSQLSGVGEVYRIVTLALGFSEAGTSYDDAGKTMGLAAYGRPLSAEPLFIRVDKAGLHFDQAVPSLIELGLAAPDRDGYSLLPRRGEQSIEKRHKDIATQIQTEFEMAYLYLARTALALGDSRNLVMSGGCALNSVANARIARELDDLDGLFIYPAATDDGNAVGAALYAHHVLLAAGSGGRSGATPRRQARGVDELTPERPTGASGRAAAARLSHVYLGPHRLNEQDILREEERWGLIAAVHNDDVALARAAAQAIARGEIVAWFQDCAEFGPRALGARSILCHPGLRGMKDQLNGRVKFRESFRPFAASVRQHAVHAWFELPVADSPFMLVVADVRPQYAKRIGEVVHVDGTCRLQSVPDELPGPYPALLREFEKITNLPMVLNTSFNLRGYPIVEQIEDAFDCLYGSRLDRLFLGRREYPGIDHRKLAPAVGEEYAAAGMLPTAALLTSDEQTLFGCCDGRDSVGVMAAALGWTEEKAVEVALELRRRGLIQWTGITTRRGLPLLPAQYSAAE